MLTENLIFSSGSNPPSAIMSSSLSNQRQRLGGGVMLNHLEAACDCEEAQKYIKEVYADPITQHYGCGGDAVESFLRDHIKKCKKCREASVEANMP